MSKSNQHNRNFTIELEEIPEVDLKILHIKKGGKQYQTCISEGESQQLIEIFKLPVQPPLYEVL